MYRNYEIVTVSMSAKPIRASLPLEPRRWKPAPSPDRPPTAALPLLICVTAKEATFKPSRACRQCYPTILALQRNVARQQSQSLPLANSFILLVQSLEDGPTGRSHRLVDGSHNFVRHDIEDGVETWPQCCFQSRLQAPHKLAIAILHDHVLQMLSCDAARLFRFIREPAPRCLTRSCDCRYGGVTDSGEQTGIDCCMSFPEGRHTLAGRGSDACR